MALDLTRTALQIDDMAVALRNRNEDRFRRLETAVDTVESFDVEAYGKKRALSQSTLTWNVPAVPDSPHASYEPPPVPDDFCVVAVDGSHIDIDRHIPARCYLINIGATVIRYGSEPDARLFSRPRLYAADDELVIRDGYAPYREQNIDGALLGAKRAVEELRGLANVLRESPSDIPTLGLVDGTLLMFGLQAYPDYVVRELVDEGFVAVLDELRQMSSERTLALASYISLPRSAELVNALRVQICPYEISDCNRECGEVKPGERPCDKGVGGLIDREVLSQSLAPGERSSVFTSASALVAQHYRDHEIHFFYVNVGEEIGRVEVPSWVAEDEALLGLAHSLVIDQCRRGPGYPVTLMESHEQAVVTGSDRRYFVELVENALYDQRLPTYSSEKNRSKRQKWI